MPNTKENKIRERTFDIRVSVTSSVDTETLKTAIANTVDDGTGPATEVEEVSEVDG